jgi:hypothetical protein
MGVRIVLDRVGLFSLLRSPTGAVARDALARGRRVQRAAQRIAPVRTGRLRESINVRMRPGIRGVVVEVGTSLNYALYQHDGTGVYGPRGRPIRARRGKVMVFDVGGQRVFAREVRGVPGTKFLARALSAAV